MYIRSSAGESIRQGTSRGNIRIATTDEDYIAWDQFLYNFSGAHYFQTYGWLRSYQPIGLTPHLLLHEVDNAITGGVAFLSAKLPVLQLRIFIIPHGPLPSGPEIPSWLPLMQALDEFCRRGNAIYAQLYPHEPSNQLVLLPRLAEMGFTSPAAFTSHQFSTDPVLVDLWGKSENDVLGAIRERTRTYVRRALSSDLELRTEVDERIFKQIYQLFLEHGESRGFLPRPYASLRAAWDWFSQNGRATFIQAWLGDTLVGANFVIFTGRTAHYIHGAVHRGFAEQRPAEFIHWHAIRKAIQLKMENYDLVNMGPPGVAQFKRGFKPRYQTWHEPRTKIYRPALAHMARVSERHLRSLVRGLSRWRAS